MPAVKSLQQQTLLLFKMDDGEGSKMNGLNHFNFYRAFDK